jgi:hypothetical protein
LIQSLNGGNPSAAFGYEDSHPKRAERNALDRFWQYQQQQLLLLHVLDYLRLPLQKLHQDEVGEIEQQT